MFNKAYKVITASMVMGGIFLLIIILGPGPVSHQLNGLFEKGPKSSRKNISLSSWQCVAERPIDTLTVLDDFYELVARNHVEQTITITGVLDVLFQNGWADVELARKALIKDYLKSSDFSTEEIAEIFGVSENYVITIANDKSIK